MSLLKVENLSIQFQKDGKVKEVLDGISFEIEPGQVLGIVGESGVGKSAGALALMGLLPEETNVSADGIWFAGEEITPPSDKNKKNWNSYQRKMTGIRGREMAMIFQNPSASLNPTMKIGRQITESIRTYSHCARKEAKEQAMELLELVGLQDSKRRMNQYPFELSGGMCQRVAIAMALSGRPKLLIADEPTTALDVTVQAQILEVLKKIRKETGTSILLISHDMGVVASICQRVLIIHQGKALEEGTVEDIFYTKGNVFTRQLLKDAKVKSISKAEAGTLKKDLPLLELNGVSKTFGNKDLEKAVDQVSLTIHQGESFALVGESGSGKSTVARLAAGIYTPADGTIEYRGNRMQMVFQDTYGSLDPKMTAGESVEEPLLIHHISDREQRKRRTEEMLNLVGLSKKDQGKFPHEFSGGQRQRICIARALILEPELVICDEAVSALDGSTQTQILDLLLKIQMEKGVSYLFISHDFHAVRKLCQNMGVMYGGSLVERGRTKEVYQDPWHPYTKVLLSSELPPDPVRARRKKGLLPEAEEITALQSLSKGGSFCPFADRCRYTMECCRKETPDLYAFKDREVACFLYSEKHTGKRSPGYQMTSQI